MLCTAARFGELISMDFFSGARFFRVVSGFMVQFGIPAESETAAEWSDKTIADDTPGVRDGCCLLCIYMPAIDRSLSDCCVYTCR